MCALSGTTSNSNETVLSCDNTGNITDGTVAYLPNCFELTTGKCKGSAVLSRSYVESKSLDCLQGNESFPGTAAIDQASHNNMVIVAIFGERHSNWVLVALLGSFAGLFINCEYFV